MEVNALSLTNEDKAIYNRALGFLKDTRGPDGKPIPLDIAAAQVADAHRKLGQRPLIIAVDGFVRRNPQTLPLKTVTEAYQELLRAKKANSMSDDYLKDLKTRLAKFAKSFQCQIADVGESAITAWLRGLKCSPRSRNNYRLAIRTFFKFGETEKFLPKGHIDFTDVAKSKEGHSDIEIFTPNEIENLLCAARTTNGQGLVPLLALGAFAGLRTIEIKRQKWSDINTEPSPNYPYGFIRVTGVKGNTAQKRLVPISANLRQWLAACTRSGELCCDLLVTFAWHSRWLTL